MLVVKRDGRKKSFCIERIYDAISKAYKEVYSELTDEQLDDVYDISRNVSNEIIALNQSKIDVETIQDIVVKNIKSFDETVAKAYQRYREERNKESKNYEKADCNAAGSDHGSVSGCLRFLRRRRSEHHRKGQAHHVHQRRLPSV